MKIKRSLLILAVTCLFLPLECLAQKAYITDSFRVTMRSGPGTDNRILDMLKSGQAVEIVERQKDWSMVRLPGQAGKEGWVINRYIMDRMPWKDRAISLEKENAELIKKLDEIESLWKSGSKNEEALTSELSRKSAALSKLENQYRTLKEESSHFLRLKQSEKAVREKLESNEKRVASLLNENEGLRSSQKNRWFATGALVLLCGLMIGILIGREQKKKKRGYY